MEHRCFSSIPRRRFTTRNLCALQLESDPVLNVTISYHFIIFLGHFQMWYGPNCHRDVAGGHPNHPTCLVERWYRSWLVPIRSLNRRKGSNTWRTFETEMAPAVFGLAPRPKSARSQQDAVPRPVFQPAKTQMLQPSGCAGGTIPNWCEWIGFTNDQNGG